MDFITISNFRNIRIHVLRHINFRFSSYSPKIFLERECVFYKKKIRNIIEILIFFIIKYEIEDVVSKRAIMLN